MSDNFLSLFAKHAESKPEYVAFQQTLENGLVRTISYSELYRKAEAVAAALVEKGVPGRHALINLPLGIEFIAAFLGCAMANVGAIPVLKPRFGRTDETFMSIASDSKAKVIICKNARASTGLVTAIEQELELDLTLLDIDNIPYLSDSGDALLKEDCSDEIFYIQYTSGSTELPKGVVIDHQNLASNCSAIAEAFSFTDEEIFVSWLPPNHDMGLVGGLLMPLWLGAQGILLNSAQVIKRPRLWLETISRYRGTVSGGPNFCFELCNQKLVNSDLDDLDLSSWRVACVGAEPVSVTTLERFSSIFAKAKFDSRALRPSYGLAEATVMVSGRVKKMQPSLPSSQDGYVSCGSPLVNCHVEIVDTVSRQRCLPGEVGEIWVSAPSVSRGYWGKAAESDQVFRNSLAFVPEKLFLRTGDLGFMLGTELFVTGRVKDLVIIRGVNYSPSQLENTVRESSAELGNILIAAFSFFEDNQEKLAIVCESPPRLKSIDPDIFKKIRGDLSRRHQIKAERILFIRFGTMPVTTSGKVQRNKCRAMYLNDQLAIVDGWSNMFKPSGIESTLAANTVLEFLLDQIAKFLGVDSSEITPGSIVSDIGLDSIEAIKLAHLIDEQFDVALPIDIFLDRTAIADIAAYVANAQSVAAPESTVPDEEIETILETLTDDEIKSVLFASPT